MRNATRTVTREDLVTARKLLASVNSEERKNTNAHQIAQALVNVRWAMAQTTHDFLVETAAQGESWAQHRLDAGE